MTHIGYVESTSSELLRKLESLFLPIVSLDTFFIIARPDTSLLSLVVFSSPCAAIGITGVDHKIGKGNKTVQRKAEKRRRIKRERLRRKR